MRRPTIWRVSWLGSNNFVVMLLPRETFKSLSGNEILISIDAQNRRAVDEMARIVRDAGGKLFANPAEIGGWMYGFGFEDLDGIGGTCSARTWARCRERPIRRLLLE